MKRTKCKQSLLLLIVVLSVVYVCPFYVVAQRIQVKEAKPNSNKNTSQQFKISDTTLKKLVGNVKSVKEFIYSPEIKFGKVELGEPAEVVFTEYNSEGNIKSREITRFASYIQTPDLDDYTPGLKPRYEEIVDIFRHEFEYDYLNKTVKMSYKSHFNGSRRSGLVIIKYENNQIAEETTYDPNGKLTSKKVVQIRDGKKIVEIEYNEDGKEDRRKETLTYVNEKNQNVIEVNDNNYSPYAIFFSTCVAVFIIYQML